MKKIRSWWQNRRLKRAISYIQKRSPEILEPQIQYSKYQMRRVGLSSKIVLPYNFHSLPETDRNMFFEQEIYGMARKFMEALMQNELISVYITQSHDDPEVIVMQSELKVLQPNWISDPKERVLHGTLSGEGHPYRIFPPQD